MTEQQKIIMWIAVGLCGAAAVVYFGMSGSFTPSETAGVPVASSSAPIAGAAAPTGAPEEEGAIPVPKASEPIKAADIPAKAVKISVSSSGFSPSSFSVNAGDRVMLAITSGDQFTHTFSFDSPTLSNFAVGLATGETRTIEFIAPGKGEYSFRCGLPGHDERGETGKMIVE